jgi:hypothetical protein
LPCRKLKTHSIFAASVACLQPSLRFGVSANTLAVPSSQHHARHAIFFSREEAHKQSPTLLEVLALPLQAASEKEMMKTRSIFHAAEASLHV